MPAGPGQDATWTGWRSAPTASCWPPRDANGYVRLWDPATGRPVGRPLPAALAAANGRAYQVAVQPGRQAAGQRRLPTGTCGCGIRRPAARSAAPASRPRNGADGVAFSPDGKLLASAGQRRLCAAVGSGHRQRRSASPCTPTSAGRPNCVYGVAFSPDGKLLASAGGDGYVRLWDPATGRPVGKPLPADPGNENGVHGVAFSPDGKLLASAGADGYVRLWDPATGRPVGKPLPADLANGEGVHGVAFSPDGKLLASAGGDGYVRLWDPATGRPVGEPLSADPSEGIVDGVVFSPDGSLLASADATGTVEIWRVWLFADPYAALCADVGPPTKADWTQYAPGEPHPNICTSR